jgi:hypothetical protein
VTRHASREEAIRATLALVEAVVTAGGGQTVPPASPPLHQKGRLLQKRQEALLASSYRSDEQR